MSRTDSGFPITVSLPLENESHHCSTADSCPGEPRPTAYSPKPAPEPISERVILLHGVGRTRASMLIMAGRFRKAGYSVANFPYNQIRNSLDAITKQFIEFIACRANAGQYHLVGHSLGSVIIRNAFRFGYPPGIGRIVMLAPPNRPVRSAIRLKNNLLYKLVLGDSGQRLAQEDFYRRLPVPPVAFGVIAGDKSRGFLFDSPNDGIVTVSETKLAGMADFTVVHHSHTFIMNAEDTFHHCLTFLRSGSFGE